MTRQDTYEGLEFGYKQMLDNIQNVTEIAKPFITQDSLNVLKRCGTSLSNIRDSKANQVCFWKIDEEWPIQTLVSPGEYRDSDKHKGHSVYAKFSFRWGIKNTNSNRDSKTFCLVDEATASIQVFKTDSDKMVALWQMEVGDKDSPGCHFHASMTERNYKQLQAGEVTENLFPEWLKVPRLPSIIITPFDALEFMLCELFQKRWPQAVSRRDHNVQSWSRSQKDRLTKLLEWKLLEVKNSNSGPWVALKKAKPNARLFAGK